MCTVSWIPRRESAGAGYDLFFNRDESRHRGRARPPARHDLGRVSGETVSALLPIDTDAGGTWVATNAHGVTVALLNLYQGRPPERPDAQSASLRSRGLLVREMADAASVDVVLARLDAIDPRRYRPFTLLVVEPTVEFTTEDRVRARTAAWDGRSLAVEDRVEPPLVSSGHDLEAALATRRAQWRALSPAPDEAPGVDACLAFHRSHEPTRGPISPCMHRHDARTVSLVHARVMPQRVEMRYVDGPPCRSPLGAPVVLDRVRERDADAA